MEGLWLKAWHFGELAGNHKVVFLFSCFVVIVAVLPFGLPCCEVHTRQKVNAASELNDKDLTLPVSLCPHCGVCRAAYAACLVAATLLPVRVCMFGCLTTPKLWHAMPDQARYSTQTRPDQARPDQAEANNNGFRFQNKRHRRL